MTTHDEVTTELFTTTDSKPAYRATAQYAANQVKLYQQLRERRALHLKRLESGWPGPAEADDLRRMIFSIDQELKGRPRGLSPVAEHRDVVKSRELKIAVELGEMFRTLSIARTGLVAVSDEEHVLIVSQIEMLKAELESLTRAYSFFTAQPAPKAKVKQTRKSSALSRRARRKDQVSPAVIADARLAEVKLEARLAEHGLSVSDEVEKSAA
jgi:hypothetical protein